MTGPSGRDVRVALDAVTLDVRGLVQLTRQVRHRRHLNTFLLRVPKCGQ